MSATLHAIEHTYRQESGRVLATLISTLRDFQLAEDVLQEAIVTALEQWPVKGIPKKPGAWLTTAARRRAIDRLRRAKNLERKTAVIETVARLEQQAQRAFDMDDIPDDRLKLIFTCCHPALKLDAQVALTLNTLGGLETEEIARAFLVPKATMAQRLVRAKRKIKQAGIPYKVPSKDALPERLNAVLSVIYLIFNEGYNASSGQTLVRVNLCQEAIRLAAVLTQLLARDVDLVEDAEALGLLALMLLHDARRAARQSPAGELVLLDEQDRSLWNHAQIEQGIAILDRAMEFRSPGPYQIQAAISALHAQAVRPEETDWRQIASLYASLTRYTDSPIVRLNMAVAIAMVAGPLKGLTQLEALEGQLQDYYLFHAARADFYRRAGFVAEARLAYQSALDLTHNDVERRFLQQRLLDLNEM